MSNILWSVLGNHAIVSFSENISTAFDVSEGVKGAEKLKVIHQTESWVLNGYVN